MHSHGKQFAPTDFVYGPTLGEGRFGTVLYAELIASSPSDERYSPLDDSAQNTASHPGVGSGNGGTNIEEAGGMKSPAAWRARGIFNRAGGDYRPDDDVETPTPGRRVRRRQRRRGYAIKVIPKSEVLRHNQIRAVLTEKYVLSEVLAFAPSLTSAPGGAGLNGSLSPSAPIMKMFMSFHDTNSLYFVLELCAGGTLLDIINQREATRRSAAIAASSSEAAIASEPVNNSDDCGGGDSPVGNSWVRYYSAQILRALEFLHQRGVVHRDLCPKNIGITFPEGRVKLGDFGAAVSFVAADIDANGCNQNYGKSKIPFRLWMPPGIRTESQTDGSNDFVGTADYVSPEMIRGGGGGGGDDYTPSGSSNPDNNDSVAATAGMDLWSYGCLVYHMLASRTPFHAPSDHLAFKRVLDYSDGLVELSFPSDIPSEAKDFISALIRTDPMNRLGMHDCVFCSGVVTGPNSGRILRPSTYESIRAHNFFRGDNFLSSTLLSGNDDFWSSLDDGETSGLTPPFRSPKPTWMSELESGKMTLRPFDSVAFDM